jgi:chemotaxis protein MotB
MDNEDSLHGQQPIIIRRKKVAHAGAHGGAWKVAYADFVTAMMAFFLVMWIMGLSQEKKSAIASYFREPGVFESTHGNTVFDAVKSGVIEKNGGKKDGEGSAQRIKELSEDSLRLRAEQEKIEEMLRQQPSFDELSKSVKMEMTNDGLRIELLETAESVFFETGQSTLRPAAIALLRSLAAELGKLPNDISIEGHTDARPYGGKEYTNWELSADRANSARRVLEESGLREHQMSEVRGLADHILRNPQDPFDVANRRVSIIVHRTSSSEKDMRTDTSSHLRESYSSAPTQPAGTSVALANH